MIIHVRCFKRFRGAWFPISSNSFFWYGNLFSLLRCSTLMHAVYIVALWLFAHYPNLLNSSFLMNASGVPAEEIVTSIHVAWETLLTTEQLWVRGESQNRKISWSHLWLLAPLRSLCFLWHVHTCAVSRLRTLPTGLRASRTPRICCCLSWLDHNCN